MSLLAVPAQLNAGDTVAAQYPEPELAEIYTSSAGDYATAWKLVFQNLDPAVQSLTEIAGTLEGAEITFISDAGLSAGSYRWRLVADLTSSRIEGTRRVTTLEGYLAVIEPAVKASFSEQMIPILEDLYEARVKGRADVISYTVGGRTYASMSLSDLRNEINFFKNASRQARGKTAWKSWAPPFGG